MTTQRVDNNFISAQVYDATYQTQSASKLITLEVRVKSDRSSEVFTIIDGEEVRSQSIQALVLSRHDCSSLSISHPIPVWWDAEYKPGVLIETFIPAKEKDLTVNVRLKLLIDQAEYETSECPSLTEGVFELHDVIGQHVVWRFATCFDCRYSWPAFLGPTDERGELRCFRDSPSILTEIRHDPKSVSPDVLHRSGEYFVTAFHRCAAWKSG